MNLGRIKISPAMVVACIALVVALGGVGYAASSSGGDERIHACFTPGPTGERGELHVIDPSRGEHCLRGESALSWNKRGRTGHRGRRGQRGRRGYRGPRGFRGYRGLRGLPGPKGATGPRGPKGDKGDPCLSSDPACVGPKGDKGDPCLSSDPACVGPKGDTGPPGPQYVAEGVVNSDGTIFAHNEDAGITVTVAKQKDTNGNPVPGQYALAADGIGKDCPVPQLTPIYGPAFSIGWGAGHCGFGHLDTDVITSDGQDHPWSYLIVGTDDPSP